MLVKQHFWLCTFSSTDLLKDTVIFQVQFEQVEIQPVTERTVTKRAVLYYLSQNAGDLGVMFKIHV